MHLTFKCTIPFFQGSGSGTLLEGPCFTPDSLSKFFGMTTLEKSRCVPCYQSCQAKKKQTNKQIKKPSKFWSTLLRWRLCSGSNLALCVLCDPITSGQLRVCAFTLDIAMQPCMRPKLPLFIGSSLYMQINSWIFLFAETKSMFLRGRPTVVSNTLWQIKHLPNMHKGPKLLVTLHSNS